MPRSATVFAGAQNSSTLAFVIDAIERKIEYQGGSVIFNPVPAPFAMPLEDFEWLHNEVNIWLALVTEQLEAPRLLDAPIQINFEIGAKDPATQTYFTKLKLLVAGTASVQEFTQDQGFVTFSPRPQVVIPWTAFRLLNQLVDQMLIATHTGKRI